MSTDIFNFSLLNWSWQLQDYSELFENASNAAINWDPIENSNFEQGIIKLIFLFKYA